MELVFQGTTFVVDIMKNIPTNVKSVRKDIHPKEGANHVDNVMVTCTVDDVLSVANVKTMRGINRQRDRTLKAAIRPQNIYKNNDEWKVVNNRGRGRGGRRGRIDNSDRGGRGGDITKHGGNSRGQGRDQKSKADNHDNVVIYMTCIAALGLIVVSSITAWKFRQTLFQLISSWKNRLPLFVTQEIPQQKKYDTDDNHLSSKLEQESMYDVINEKKWFLFSKTY
ncbi:unnamed protein product [Mytilus edulis]|uniref:Uncharacterized protein n=1 Tax=Mytilus edulis TaxID=6550 RepID=A0A8S3SY35_MYTED|nr:unnamed protein product [Mytilus edulis]